MKLKTILVTKIKKCFLKEVEKLLTPIYQFYIKEQEIENLRSNNNKKIQMKEINAHSNQRQLTMTLVLINKINNNMMKVIWITIFSKMLKNHIQCQQKDSENIELLNCIHQQNQEAKRKIEILMRLNTKSFVMNVHLLLT